MQNMSIGSVFHAVQGSQSIQTEYNNTLNNEGSGIFMSWVSLSYKLQTVSEALKNMLEAHKFTEEYSCLLQKYISPEDYERAMKEYPERLAVYARKPEVLSDAEIALRAKVLLSATDEELDSEELAEMMNADVFQVEYALRKYSKGRAENQ